MGGWGKNGHGRGGRGGLVGGRGGVGEIMGVGVRGILRNLGWIKIIFWGRGGEFGGYFFLGPGGGI
jgi:hypothetical protein